MPPVTRGAHTVDGKFISTRWAMVLAAGDSELASAAAGAVLSDSGQTYWRPLYLFLRREGVPSEDAQDLTPGFFAELISDRLLRRADRDKGRFRSFLLGALKRPSGGTCFRMSSSTSPNAKNGSSSGFFPATPAQEFRRNRKQQSI
jgi:hypothetical protein